MDARAYNNRNNMSEGRQATLAILGMEAQQDIAAGRDATSIATTAEEVRGRGFVADTQAAASRYGADQTLKGAQYKADMDYKGLSVPRVSETTSYDLTPEKIPGWGTPGLARGGLAQAARPYLVGEKGPELMVPDQNGTVIPNHRLQAILARKPIPRAEGGRVFREPPPGTQWVGRQSLANAGQAARTAAEVRLHEDDARAKYFEPTVPKLQAQALTDAKDEASFRAQASAMFTVAGQDGKSMIDPRATALINLYAKLPVTPEYALGAVQHGMEIHKLADSWKDGTRLAEVKKSHAIPPELEKRLLSGSVPDVLEAERQLGNNHGLDPGVLTGKRKAIVPGSTARIVDQPWPTAPAATAPATPPAAVAPVAPAGPVPDPALSNIKSLVNAGVEGGKTIYRGAQRFNAGAQATDRWFNKQAGQVIPGIVDPTSGELKAPWTPNLIQAAPAAPVASRPVLASGTGPYMGAPVPIAELAVPAQAAPTVATTVAPENYYQ